MQAGKLRQRVTLQQVTRVPNQYGEMVETWADVATLYAAVEPLRGREFFDAEQVQADISHRVRIRYYPGVDSMMRFRFGTRYLYVNTAINVDERRREMHCMCREMPDA